MTDESIKTATPSLDLSNSIYSYALIRDNPRNFNEIQSNALELLFKSNEMPSRDEKMELAKKINLKYKQVSDWFSSTRFRRKKVFTKEQAVHMEEVYRETPQPSVKLRKQIANKFKVSKYHIDNWFCYRRRMTKISQLKAASK